MSTSKKVTPKTEVKPVEAKKTGKPTPKKAATPEKKPVVVPTKKAVGKTTEKTSLKKETPTLSIISAQKTGAVMIAVIEGKNYSRKVTKEVGETILKKVAIYNKKPTVKLKDELIGLLTPEATSKKKVEEDKVVKVKALKKQIQKEDKTPEGKKAVFNLEEELDKALQADPDKQKDLQAILNKYKIKVEASAPAAAVTKKPTKKEVYRDGRRVWIYVAEDGTEVNWDGSKIVS